MNIKSPCMGCPERKVGCHSTCDKYLDYRSKLDGENKKINDAKSKDATMYEYVFDRLSTYDAKRKLKK